jgi:hypothetical protein
MLTLFDKLSNQLLYLVDVNGTLRDLNGLPFDILTLRDINGRIYYVDKNSIINPTEDRFILLEDSDVNNIKYLLLEDGGILELDIPVIPPLPSNCVEFVVDTTEGTNFVVRLNAELDVVVNYTINWGDGTTDEDSYTGDDEEYTNTSVFHEFPEENSTYTVRLCFDNPSAVTQFAIDIND